MNNRSKVFEIAEAYLLEAFTDYDAGVQRRALLWNRHCALLLTETVERMEITYKNNFKRKIKIGD